MSSGQLLETSMSLPLLCLDANCRKLRDHDGNHDRHPNLLLNLPDEIVYKINKTTQTRGAQPYNRVQYQNRVARWSRAVVPLKFKDAKPIGGYENGYTIMVHPKEYFDNQTKQKRAGFPEDVIIGENAFIFYSTRKDWNAFPPLPDWIPCSYVDDSNQPLKKRGKGGVDRGHYIARVPATNALQDGDNIVRGVPQGIRFFEYASFDESWKTKLQLAYLSWHTVGISDVVSGPMPEHLIAVLQEEQLLDTERLVSRNVIDTAGRTICPLCRDLIQSRELMEKSEQVSGREIADLTVTDANLFHLDDLKPGEFNHRSYGLGWGHHHCNTVARDHGIEKTLDWMEEVLIRAGRMTRS